jgi:FixJ family two-component response regulator
MKIGKPGDTPRLRISIVDDDESIREALKSLMRSVQFDVEAFESAEAFLASEHSHHTSCLILDLSLPGMNGFDLQNHLNREQRSIPVIFITAHADAASRQRALKAGAIDLLSKPVRREPLFKAIQSAVER